MFISFVLLAVLWCMVLILPIKYGKKKEEEERFSIVLNTNIQAFWNIV